MQTLLLDGEAVAANAALPAVTAAVEDAFAAYERGDATMPPKSYIDLPQHDGDFRSMPAYIDAGDWEGAAVKWVNSHPHNPDRHDLPTVMGTVIYSDPATAFPLAVMDGTRLTAARTGAAAAVATDHLAVPDARSVGLIGAGAQAVTQLDAIAGVRDVERVVVSDRDEQRVAAFVDRFDDAFDVRAGSVADAAACDVVSTTTPVETPIVEREMVGADTHVNAMGADAAGKHELADDLLLDAKIVIDDHDQCTHSGEINVPYAAGILTDDDIHAELGAVVTGAAAGRTDADGITVFDSTGLAIQDVAAARIVYERAVENGDGTTFDLLDLDG
jgi:alanine dehydrogenase